MHAPDKGNFLNECIFLKIDKPKLLAWDRLSKPLFQVEVKFEKISDTETKVIFKMKFKTPVECEKINLVVMINIFRIEFLENLKIAFIFLYTISPTLVVGKNACDNCRIEKNISYTESNSKEQELDLFYPINQNNFPTLIFIHGGSLSEWDKGDEPYAEIAKNFVANGIACVLINYRLAPQFKWPSMPEDAASAFHWVKQNIKTRGGDTTRIFISGHSSGALIAAILSTDKKYIEKFGYTLKDIAGCISMGTMLNPSYDVEGVDQDKLKEYWEQAKKLNSYESYFPSPDDYMDADPYRHINNQIPPFLILIAEQEQINPPILEHANKFSEAAMKLNREVSVEILNGRKHITAMQMMKNSDDPALLKIINFIKR